MAELAAQGHSNPKIAQALFVTRKTVETHLGHIYAKLGIASRAELARASLANLPNPGANQPASSPSPFQGSKFEGAPRRGPHPRVRTLSSRQT